MKKSLLVLALAAAFAPTLAFAEAGDWVVRIRAADVSPDEKSKLGTVSAATPLGGVGGLIAPGSQLTVDNNVIPELDISYYITKNIAAELILATGTRHKVAIAGNTAAGAIGDQPLGSVNLLPPTLTGQWHFNPDQTIDPYLGAGVNYTHSFDRNLATTNPAGLPIKIKQNMFGVVGQAGVDVNLAGGWLINADVKYITMKTSVLINPGSGFVKIDNLKINPWVFGVGIGHKF